MEENMGAFEEKKNETTLPAAGTNEPVKGGKRLKKGGNATADGLKRK